MNQVSLFCCFLVLLFRLQYSSVDSDDEGDVPSNALLAPSPDSSALLAHFDAELGRGVSTGNSIEDETAVRSLLFGGGGGGTTKKSTSKKMVEVMKKAIGVTTTTELKEKELTQRIAISGPLHLKQPSGQFKSPSEASSSNSSIPPQPSPSFSLLSMSPSSHSSVAGISYAHSGPSAVPVPIPPPRPPRPSTISGQSVSSALKESKAN